MKLDQDTTEGLMYGLFFVIVISIVVGGLIWDNQQVRVMYSNAYTKNQECRIAFKFKSSDYRYIDTACGSVPRFEDYRND